MPRDYQRTDRIADLLARELATLIQREVSDPRVKFATISSVELSKDYSIAKVYVNVLDKTKIAEILAGLDSCKGFLRSLLAKRTELRGVPRLRFVHDESFERGYHIEQLLRETS